MLILQMFVVIVVVVPSSAVVVVVIIAVLLVNCQIHRRQQGQAKASGLQDQTQD